MEANNIGISVGNLLDQSDLSTTSSIEMKPKPAKIQKLEILITNKANNGHNNNDSSSMIFQLCKEIGNLENGLDEMKKTLEGFQSKKDEEKCEIDGQIAEMKGKIDKFNQENAKINEVMAEKNVQLEGQIAGLWEEFGRKTHELKEFNKMLANLIERIDGKDLAVFDPMGYKLNSADCSEKLIISADGLKATKLEGFHSEFSTVRATLPIPILADLDGHSPRIAFYFEVQILAINRFGDRGIGIGFCSKEFPLEKKILRYENSIGIVGKEGIYIDGNYIKIGYGNGVFEQRDTIGIGIIHCSTNSSLKCFATCNGELLGKAKLPEKFADIQLFPAVNLLSEHESICANFQTEEWRFTKFKYAIE